MKAMMENSMTAFVPHTPVLLEQSIEFLIAEGEENGIYVDATLGGGGHSEAFLEALDDDGKLIGLDQDPEALEAASNRLSQYENFETIKGNFAYLATLIPPEYHGKITGIFFDLGVSTHQIREAERGFSFQDQGPLDMRMSDTTGISAYDVVNRYEYKKLRDIIYHYGEERLSRQIAKSIIERRPIENTIQLREAIESVIYGPKTIKSVARVFQAIRIEVNRELDALKEGLQAALDLLQPGGRLVVISYHSLEDRIVKNFFRSGNFEGTIEKDFFGNPVKPLQVITKQIITPSDEEIERNPAARSAKLRVAEKVMEE